MKLILAYDHGLEHGPKDFESAKWAVDPSYAVKLAKEGKLDGIALQIGVAQDYWHGEIPLILKINGKTNIPDEEPIAAMTSSVEEAKEIGAWAVGYTLYVGSARQEEDLERAAQVRRECQEAGLPLILWAYPRGEEVKKKGGPRSIEMIAYAARVAQEVGADMCKLNLPKGFNLINLKWIIESAGMTKVLFSGGAKIDDKELLRQAKLVERAGAEGMILGRNLWQRKHDQAIELIKKMR
jgi:class I fructose-bisphosphate aldolase